MNGDPSYALKPSVAPDGAEARVVRTRVLLARPCNGATVQEFCTRSGLFPPGETGRRHISGGWLATLWSLRYEPSRWSLLVALCDGAASHLRFPVWFGSKAQ